MRRWMRWAVAGLGVLVAGAQFLRPARTNPAADPAGSLAAARGMPPRVTAVLERGCRDCHSNGTRWPWYSQVAPVSWFVIDHVNHGRSHFNYSEWTRYDDAEAARLLKNACDLARKGEMPLRSYTLIHRDARLSPEDVDALCSWTGGQATRR